MFRELCRYDPELRQLIEDLRHSKRATDAIRGVKYDCTFTPSGEKLRKLHEEATSYQDELIAKMEVRLKGVFQHLIVSAIVDEIWEGK